MRSCCIAIYLVSLVYIFTPVFAQKTPLQQNIKFEKITAKDGLSQSHPLSILQDSQGFIWVGTYNGLNKYDGYQFTTFTPDPDDSASLSHQVVTTIFEDSKNNLWIGTSGRGLNLFDRDLNRFIRFEKNDNDPKAISHNEIGTIEEDKFGNLWIGTNGGGLNILYFESEKNHKFKQLIIKDSSHQTCKKISAIEADHQGNMWVVGECNDRQVLFCIEPNKYNKLKNEPFQSTIQLKPVLEDFHITDIKLGNNYNIWISTSIEGLLKYDASTDSLIQYNTESHSKSGFKSNNIQSLSEIKNNILLMGTKNSGLMGMDIQQEKFSVYQHDPLEETSISGNRISSVYIDRFGTLWVGVNDGYLNKAALRTEKFKAITVSPDYPKSLRNNNVKAITEGSDNTIWIGTEEGITTINRKGSEPVFRQFHKGNGLAQEYVRKLYTASDQTIWIGTMNQISRYFPEKDRFVHYDLNANINNIDEDSRGEIWLGTWGSGIFKYNPKSNEFVNHKIPGITNNVWCLFIDSDDNIWVTIKNNGIYRFDRASNSFVNYNNPAIKDASNLSINDIYSIFEDSDNRLWLGTNTGIYRLKNNADAQYCCKESNKFLDLVAYAGMLEDENGNYWVATNKGLYKFNPHSASLIIFGFDDNLLGMEFNQGAIYRSSNGDMYLGSKHGCNYFHPENIKINTTKPPVIITGFNIFNKPVNIGDNSPLDKDITQTSEIHLNHTQKSFSFEFVALNYNKPASNEYAYKLAGFDKEWNYIGNRRIATYTNVPGGTYYFHVKAANNDGVWNEEGSMIKVIISPPFWKTLWFNILILMFVIILIVTWNKIRLYQLRKHNLQLENEVHKRTSEVLEQKNVVEDKNKILIKQKDQLKKMSDKVHEADQMKIRFFTNISHEFRTPLSLIHGPLNELSEFTAIKQSDKASRLLQLIENNSKHLLKLVNQIMDISKIESGYMKLQVQEGDIVSFIKEIYDSFQYKAEVKNIEYSYNRNQNTFVGWYDQDKLEKIFFNLLSNAFKFTPENGVIQINLNIINKSGIHFLEVSITDNGAGIPETHIGNIFKSFYQADYTSPRQAPGTGLGLSLVYQLAKIHKGNVTVSSKVGSGTTFKVKIPLDKDYYTPSEIHTAPAKKTLSLETETSYKAEKPDQSIVDELEISSQNKTETILIVEDNPEMLNYINLAFEKSYNILNAKNGKQGIEVAMKNIPDIIITDIMMPQVDGNSLCRRLKAEEKTSHIPIIMLTAKSGKDHEITGFHTGADDYISKPFDVALLKVRVQTLIKNRQKLREKFLGEVIQLSEHKNDEYLKNDFISEAITSIVKNIENPEYGVEDMCMELGMSRTQLYNKIRAATGLSVNAFVKSIRLKNAAKMLLNTDLDINEIAYKVGFSDRKYFSKCFKSIFDCSPSKYREDKKVV